MQTVFTMLNMLMKGKNPLQERIWWKNCLDAQSDADGAAQDENRRETTQEVLIGY